MRQRTQKIRIALICGGQSPEHEISLLSGRTATLQLDRSHYSIKPICIRRDGRWAYPRSFFTARSGHTSIETLFGNFSQKKISRASDQFEMLPLPHALARMKKDRIECALIILHGEFGEDGTIQGLFDMMHMPYTGSNVLASSLGMDKVRCQSVLNSKGIHIPQNIMLHVDSLRRINWTMLAKRVSRTIGFPCFVKPSGAGSSVGMNIARKEDELKKGITAACAIDTDILLEEYINGTEVSCGVLDIVKRNDCCTQLPLAPTEIIPLKSAFFDYNAKYTDGMSEEITPARISKSLTGKVQQCALRVHNIIGCEGMSRVDMIIRNRVLFVLEVNTIPGMTPLSLLPRGAAAVGIAFSTLLDHLIRHAMYRSKRQTAKKVSRIDG